MAGNAAATGPDFSAGVNLADLPDEGTLAGRVGDEPVLLSRLRGELFAIGGTCTHYGGLLADGLADAGTVRCPLHHACFDLRTGRALRAPAFDPVDRWRVDQQGGRIFVREKLAPATRTIEPPADVRSVVIVGGGAAGFACAYTLRSLGFSGAITMLSADSDPPCDRPNLSKDFLAGTAPPEWIPLRGEDWYREQAIALRLGTPVDAIDVDGKAVVLGSGERIRFDRLLIATGSDARRLNGHEFGGDHVFTLRSVADAEAIIRQAEARKRAVIIGSSFIGLETAASLRHRGVEVDVVSPEHIPFERVFGTDLGRFLQQLHETNGVRFHLGTAVGRFDDGAVSLASGTRLPADFVIVGIGAQPRTGLAEAAGLDTGNGVHVDRFMQTSAPGVFAAGDIAGYPDPTTGERVRIEHWAVAERQGETAAANMLGLEQSFASAPFFWTEQYGFSVRYVGHAADWDEARVEGEIGPDGFVVRYFSAGRHLATASVNRDRENLEDELKLEAAD